VTVGAAAVPTVMEAVAVLPVPPLVEVTGEVVLVLTPGVVPVTLSETVHDPPAAIVPAESAMLPLPAMAVAVPLHVLASAFGAATMRPDGKLSVNATPASAMPALGLVMVKLSDVAPPIGILAAPNAFARIGAVPAAGVVVALALLLPRFGSNWSLCEIEAVLVVTLEAVTVAVIISVCALLVATLPTVQTPVPGV